LKSTLFLAALATTLPALSFSAFAQDGPPGLVKIKGDRFEIGADTNEIKDLIEETQFTVLASETPKHSVKLEDFFIMPTEVTNEQFAKFVAATNTEPPQSWGDEAIGAAGFAYATETGKAKKDAQDAGLPIPSFEPFDRAIWWKKNWKEADWKIPKGKEAFPVVFINYGQAEGYARWAGLRLMSEEEFQAAGHGKTDRKYAWGNDADPKKTNCTDTHLGGPAKVGTHQAGSAWVDSVGRIVEERTERNAKEVSGLYDLSGNVWEWTRSPFKAYPGFKPLSVKLDSGKEQLVPDFDGDHRTVVSGAFNGPILTTRLTTRRNTARWQATDGVGMRCSASAVPGLDIAESFLRMDLPTTKRPDDVVYLADKITAVDRWVASAGSAPVPEYRVIESYDYTAFVPVEEIPVNTVMTLKKISRDKPVEIGAFSTTVPILEPALEPGTYMLSWRAAGKFLGTGDTPEDDTAESIALQDDGTEEAPAVAPEFPFDPMRDTLLIRNTEGELVGWTTVGIPGESRLAPGRVALSELAGKEAERAGKKAGTVLTFKVFAPYKKANKGFEFSIPLTVKTGTVDDTWRK